MRNKKIIGIDFGGTKINFAYTENKEVKRIFKFETGKIKDKNDIINKILSGISALKSDFDAIGIGMAGMINHKNGEAVLLTNIGGIQNFPLKKELENIVKKPVFVDNDVNVALFGESRLGSIKSLENAIFVSVGTGIGGAIMLSRKLYTGKDGFAGEFGHITVKENGLKCGCGKRGCLETVASGTGIERYVKNRLNKKTDITAKEIVEQAKHGDTLSLKAIENAAHYISRVSGDLINIFNPDALIFGGGVMESDFIYEKTKAKIHQFALPMFLKNMQITRSTLKNNAGAIGAALLALELLNGNNVYV